MTSHDALTEQLTQTITVAKAVRDKIHYTDNSSVRLSEYSRVGDNTL
jgi:hypothetical protein